MKTLSNLYGFVLLCGHTFARYHLVPTIHHRRIGTPGQAGPFGPTARDIHRLSSWHRGGDHAR